MKYIIDITEEKKEAIETILGTKLEKVKEERSKKLPERGDWYFCLDTGGKVVTHLYDADDYDLDKVKTGNIFRTRKEAEKWQDLLKMIGELRKSYYYIEQEAEDEIHI